MKSNVFVKPDEQNKARFNSAMARKGAMKWNSHSVFATPKHLAFRLPQKIPFPKTVICYLLFVTQKIRFRKLLTVICYLSRLWLTLFALMMLGVYEYFTNTQYKEVLMYC